MWLGLNKITWPCQNNWVEGVYEAGDIALSFFLNRFKFNDRNLKLFCRFTDLNIHEKKLMWLSPAKGRNRGREIPYLEMAVRNNSFPENFAHVLNSWSLYVCNLIITHICPTLWNINSVEYFCNWKCLQATLSNP